MKPTRCTLLLGVFISTSLHVSANHVPVIRRTYCFYATLVFFTLYGWLSGLHYSWYIYFNFSTCFDQLCAHHQENLLYLCDTGIFHSVWVAVWSAALFLVYVFISTSLHISSNHVPIIRRTYCFYATLVFFTLYGWLSGLHYSWYIYFNFSTCFGQLCAHHQDNLLYLCYTGIFHCVWVAVWSALFLGIFISTSLHVSANYVPITLCEWLSGLQTRQPPIQSEK